MKLSPKSTDARRSLKAFFLLGLIGLTGCASDVTVKEKPPQYHPLSSMSVTAATGQKIIHAMRLARVSPLVALGENIQASQEALAALKQHPRDASALHDYNFAVSRIIGIIHANKLDPWTHPLLVPSPSGGTYFLEHKPDPRPMWNPALYTFTPADQFMIGGKYVEEHVSRTGMGAPVVAVGKEDNKGN